MSVIGTFGGGGIGLAIGGPIGALIGALTGHYLVDREGAPFGTPSPDVILGTGLVALAAKMARADGVVLRSEIAAFETVVIVAPADRPRVERLFRLAQATTAGFQAYAAQLAATFRDQPELLDAVVEGLLMVAKADGAVHEAELAYLREVARIFGRSPAWFETLIERHVVQPGDPYRQIGADRDWGADALRAHHRKLVRELHPDREIARGLPEAAIRIATERFARINAAWDRIVQERGLPR